MMAIVRVLRASPFLYIFLISISALTASSVTDSEALLRLKKSFMNTESLEPWKPGAEPCANGRVWPGLQCDKGMVTGLRLREMNLSGKVDVDALVLISGLRSISVVNNSFSGPIPEFHRMGALKAIFLSGNRFSGEIPSAFFTTMGSLKKVWLSQNRFTGEIPSSLTQLRNLIELHLEDNQFSGVIPRLEQRTLDQFDVSNNNLRGEIPSSLSRFNASAFEGNAGLCGAQLGKSCGTSLASSLPPEKKSNDKKSNMIAYGLLISAVIIFSLMMLGIFVLRRRQLKFDTIDKENLEESIALDESIGVDVSTSASSKKYMDDWVKKRAGSLRKGSSRGRSIGDLVMVNEEKGIFGLADLMKASAEVLGNGALGLSYKAMMSSGMIVVVKRIREMNKMGRDGFDAEVRRLGNFRHRNVLTPLAYHYRKDERLLVFEYIPKGSLLHLLHGDRGPSHAELNWPARLKIIQGIARGLGYLHTELASLVLPHGDLKSSNVLLAPDLEPLLVDYGFSAFISTNQAAQALFAYKSPEAAQDLNISPKCDVYCLGIIILEILTGKFPTQYVNNGNGGIDLVRLLKAVITQGKETELLDPDIANARQSSLDEMVRLLHIGAACTESNPNQRLDVREAIMRIEEIQIEGGRDGRTYHVLPSLRDGYADAPGSRLSPQVSGGQERGQASWKRHDSFGNQSGRRNSDSFAFDIS
ncbi:hypothetical protein RJ640_008386 [Escallonia rubra]|uniref:Protein kinase domain-containing protein n=1 Tax=Escallonia rubra TaxID=112253 RepID=A0AA88ULB8_9ASTE|nr:hypothetical protein RJ640_008386 [Escallonia rubra]